MMTYGMTLGDVCEAWGMGETMQDAIEKREKEMQIQKAKNDILSVEFEKAIYTTIEWNPSLDNDDLLWVNLAMNYHHSFSPGGCDERIQSVKNILGSDFRKKIFSFLWFVCCAL